MPAALRAGPFVLAIVVARRRVLSAPFVGLIRGAVQREFPGRLIAHTTTQ